MDVMSLEKVALSTLRFLFTEYKRGPSVVYHIQGIARKYNVDPLELSNYLLENSWIRECWAFSNDNVACKITVSGIEQVDPLYVRERLVRILGIIADAGGSKPLLEILEFKIEDFSIALDLVNQLETLGLAKIYNPDRTIIVAITDAGYRYYEKKGKHLMALMA